MIKILIILAILFLLYLFALSGRTKFTDFRDFKKYQFAHRGLFGNGIPENSLKAFKNAVANGYGAELDIHLTKDGNLAVIHDASLLRTAGVDLKIEDLTLKEAQNYTLEGTDETIPAFEDVLAIFEDKYPLIIELKSENNNVNELCSKAAEVLDNYKGVYCIESVDPSCVRWFYKNRPNVIRGQLSSNFLKDKKVKMNFFQKLVMTLLLTNFLTKPDFISFSFKDRKLFSFVLSTELFKLQKVAWTIKTKEDVETAIKEDIIPIFEDR